MYELDERDTQTRIKHEILREYLIKWGSIITSGISTKYAEPQARRSRFQARFVYVDYFSYLGAYCENAETVYGSPVLGVKALDEIKQSFITRTSGLTPTITAVLFEENTATFNRLLVTLQSLGYTDRIKRQSNLMALGDGDIAVINDDSSQYVDRVLEFIDRINPTYSFHFVDPYGSKGVERSNIEKIVSKKRSDCIINMMLNPLVRFIGAATKDESASPERAKGGYFDRYFGSDVWRDIARDLASGVINRQEAERQLVDEFDKILHKADSSLAVKQIPLRFQDRDQTLYHLFLTTHDPTGAFEMNEILADAKIREYDYRKEKRQMKTHPGQMSLGGLFDQLPDDKRPVEPQPDIDLLADNIYDVCKTRTMRFREVLVEMVNSPYFEQDVRQALGELRQQKRASFEVAPSRLRIDSEVKFL